MSYIRSLSNPEGLYVIHGISGKAEFFLNDPKRFLCMPAEIFNGLLDKYVRQDAEEHSSEGNEVYLHQGASLKYLAPPEQMAAFGRSCEDWKWFLHYEDWQQPIEMWDVTLDYIAQEARRQYEEELLLDSMEAKFADVDSLKPLEALKLFRMWLKEPG